MEANKQLGCEADKAAAKEDRRRDISGIIVYTRTPRYVFALVRVSRLLAL